MAGWSSVGHNFLFEQEVGLQTTTGPFQHTFPGVCDPAQESCHVAQWTNVHTLVSQKGV